MARVWSWLGVYHSYRVSTYRPSAMAPPLRAGGVVESWSLMVLPPLRSLHCPFPVGVGGMLLGVGFGLGPEPGSDGFCEHPNANIAATNVTPPNRIIALPCVLPTDFEVGRP